MEHPPVDTANEEWRKKETLAYHYIYTENTLKSDPFFTASGMEETKHSFLTIMNPPTPKTPVAKPMESSVTSTTVLQPELSFASLFQKKDTVTTTATTTTTAAKKKEI
eukprot:8456906-Ditylum_brightwellii.AAC.1